MERALAGFIGSGLTQRRIKRGNDVVARFAANQNAAHETVGTSKCLAGARQFRRRTISQVGTVALSPVNDQQLRITRCFQHLLA